MTDAVLLVSPEFWVAFLLYAVADHAAAGVLRRRARYVFMLVASVVFLWAFTGIGLVPLLSLYVSLAALFVAARAALGRDEASGRLPRVFLVLAVAATAWALGKLGTALDIGRLSWLFILGSSFLLVKIWTFLKDLHDRRIRDPELLVFLGYCTFFPCFISGPMHYYGEFVDAFERREPLSASRLVGHGFRILHGLVKVLVIAVILRPFSLDAIREFGMSEVSVGELGVRSVVYSFVLYLDFSGYSDIVIGAGGLLGVKVPENFRLPYLASNIREFWQRWHITFTRFLTQYLFVPLVRRYRQSLGTGPLTTTVGYTVTFLFCGFWHGSTLNFLAWGAFHAAGLSAYDYYRSRRTLVARSKGRPVAAASLPLRSIYTLGTFAFVSLGWLFFVLPIEFWTR